MWIRVRNRPAALERVLPKATADERETLPAGAARLSQPLFEPKAQVVAAPEGDLGFRASHRQRARRVDAAGQPDPSIVGGRPRRAVLPRLTSASSRRL